MSKIKFRVASTREDIDFPDEFEVDIKLEVVSRGDVLPEHVCPDFLSYLAGLGYPYNTDAVTKESQETGKFAYMYRNAITQRGDIYYIRFVIRELCSGFWVNSSYEAVSETLTLDSK